MPHRRPGHPADVRYSDSQCVAALRAAAVPLGGAPLRVSDYQGWRSSQATPVPNDKVIRWRFGTWAEALAVAGLPSMRAPYQPHGPTGTGATSTR